MSFSKGIIWDLFGKTFSKGIGFVISIFLARLLTPEDFGLIGMVMVVVIIAEVYVDMGFGASLIQRQSVSEELFSSVFWLNLFMGLLMTLTLYLSSPWLAAFYDRPQLNGISKVLSFVFLIGSFGIIQTIRLTKKMDFKSLTIVNAISNISSGILGITLALVGYGVWALIFQQLSNRVINVVGLWIVEKWSPRIHFSFKDIKLIWGFSSKKFLTTSIRTFFGKLDSLLIAKLFSAATLGFYSRGRSLTDLVVSYTSGSLSKVFFPYVSNHQDDIDALKKMYKKSLMIVGFFSVAISTLLFISAKEVTVGLFSVKWLESTSFFVFMIIADGFTKPIGSIMLSLIVGLGHAGTEFKLILIKRSLWLIPIFILFQFGIEVFLYSTVIYGLMVHVIDSYSVTKHFPISMFENSYALIKFILTAAFASLIIYIFPKTSVPLIDLAINSVLFILIYVAGVYIVEPEPLRFCINKINKVAKLQWGKTA